MLRSGNATDDECHREGESSVRFLTLHQRHHGHRRAVLLMIVVEGIVPPTAISFLKRQKDVRKMVLEVGTLFAGQRIDALGRVPVAVVIEVAGYGEERIV